MTLGDAALISTAAMILGAIVTAIVLERRRSRRILGALHHELSGLCHEAADLAEAVAARRAERAFDPALMDRYTLSEPQTYPALAPTLWRLPSEHFGRAVEFHGRLSIARARWAAWRADGQGEISTYLLVSALTRAVNGVEPLIRYVERRQGWPQKPPLRMPQASRFLDEIENANPEFLDRAYWSE